MLNEFIEVSEYMFEITGDDLPFKRITRSVFLWQNAFLGLERVLTMIARFFIYEDGADYEEGLRRADAAIRMWCGHAPANTADDKLADQYEYLEENYPWLDNWLSQYLRESVSKDKESSMEKVEEGLKVLAKKKAGFSGSSLNKQPKGNDFKAIKYDKVIANAAVSGGPLKMYYLACRDADWDQNLKGDKRSTLNAGQHDRVLKTIGAYMLERSRKERPDNLPRFEPINYSDIALWALNEGKLSRDKYKGFTVDGRPIFLFQTGMSGNAAKVKPDPEWFNACGWELIDATEDDSALDEFLDNNPDGIFYSDSGSGKPLELNFRYIR